MSRCDACVLLHPARVLLIDEYSSVVNPVVHNQKPTSTDELSNFFFLFEVHVHISSAVFNFLGQKKGKLNSRGA